MEILGRANPGVFVDVDIRVAKHALDEDRDRRQSECPLLQVGQVNAGEKLTDVELAVANIALPAAVVGIDVNRQIDVPRLHGAVDQRPAAIVLRAGHSKFQSHLSNTSSDLLPQRRKGAKFGIVVISTLGRNLS